MNQQKAKIGNLYPEKPSSLKSVPQPPNLRGTTLQPSNPTNNPFQKRSLHTSSKHTFPLNVIDYLRGNSDEKELPENQSDLKPQKSQNIEKDLHIIIFQSTNTSTVVHGVFFFNGRKSRKGHSMIYPPSSLPMRRHGDISQAENT